MKMLASKVLQIRGKKYILNDQDGLEIIYLTNNHEEFGDINEEFGDIIILDKKNLMNGRSSQMKKITEDYELKERNMKKISLKLI